MSNEKDNDLLDRLRSGQRPNTDNSSNSSSATVSLTEGATVSDSYTKEK